MTLKDYLKENHITIKELSQGAGIPYSTINEIVSGKTDISKCTAITINAIAKYLGTTMDKVYANDITIINNRLEIHKGKELEELYRHEYNTALLDSGVNEINSRDFVADARDYFTSDYNKVYIVSGLRGTGKTFGLLQAINGLDALYILAPFGGKLTGKACIDILKQNDKKYIIIDEYSWISERDELDNYLYMQVLNGKRIAITGTHSISLDYLNAGNLVHRAKTVNINLFPYDEYLRVYNKKDDYDTCLKYLQNGGMFESYAIKNYKGMEEYIKKAVIDNITSYISMPEEKVKAILYTILYMGVCPSDTDKVPLPSRDNMDYYNMLLKFGVDPETRFEKTDFEVIADVLEQTDFIISTDNLNKEAKDTFRLNIVNPAISYQMVKEIFGKEPDDYQKGYLFEGCTVSSLKKKLYNSSGKIKTYFLHTDTNDDKEIELVIKQSKDTLFLVDVKLQDDIRLKDNASIINIDAEKYLADATVKGRYIVCNAPYEAVVSKNDKDVIFTGLAKESIYHYQEFDKNLERISGRNDTVNLAKKILRASENFLLPDEEMKITGYGKMMYSYGGIDLKLNFYDKNISLERDGIEILYTSLLPNQKKNMDFVLKNIKKVCETDNETQLFNEMYKHLTSKRAEQGDDGQH